ncbi:MAG TPA: caspase family protein [Candidatus Tectomicrobia bacterium]|nr:caspase family protein [Candidatus Tectomicrobia bacterium]
MAMGRALAIGLNSVDPQHYGGWTGDLNACEADAEDMTSIARSQKMDVTTLMTSKATRTEVIQQITKTAAMLKKGDLFVMSYSGHGGQLPDLNSDEPDAQDETWCLYDGELVDDELYSLLGKFASGVRILVFSDSCHSGSVVKLAYYRGMVESRSPTVSSESVKYRFMPPEVALRTYRANKDFYMPILKNKKLKEARDAVKASVVLISGCQDNQLSADGDFNGLFTANMLRVWNDGTFKGDHQAFHQAIVRRMPPDQTPNYFRVGPMNKAFEAKRPLMV